MEYNDLHTGTGRFGVVPHKGGAAYGGQGDGTGQAGQTAGAAVPGGEGERGRLRPAALRRRGHPLPTLGGAGGGGCLWGLRPLRGGPGGGGGLGGMRGGGPGGGLLRLSDPPGLHRRTAVHLRLHAHLRGELRLLRREAAAEALGHAHGGRAVQRYHRLYLPVRGRVADGGRGLLLHRVLSHRGRLLVLPAAPPPPAHRPGGGDPLPTEACQPGGAGLYGAHVPVLPDPV